MERQPAPDAATSRWRTRSRFRMAVLLAFTVIGFYLCYLLTAPFLPALTWALALAILFMPAHRWIEGKVRHPALAATISVLVVGTIVVVPTLFVGTRLVQEAGKGVVTVQEKIQSGEWLRAIEAHPTTAAVARWIDEADLPEALTSAASRLTDASARLIREWISYALTLLLTFYMLFYFLRDRGAALDLLRDMSPLPEAEMQRLFARVADTVYATVYGTVAVALVQGALGGLMFWLLDLQAPLLWGIVMGLLAIVPVLGAFIVWVPVAAFLALDGQWGQAVILTAWGAIIVGGIDNLLYPMLVGDRLRLHTVPAFIAIIGGLILFGASGLILGPLAVAITLFLFETWKKRLGERQD